ncbi:MAG: choice-of-anchor J domain-containing protein [Prevotella sp.]|nr:choice-of-anchor J domain-containing protein [Prevotella sp.]
MKKIAKLMTLALAVITLASCEDVPSPFGTVTPPKTQGESSTVEPAGDGTAANPFNIAAAIAKCKEIGSTESTEKYYVKGVVVNAGAADATYGNASFYMADEEDTSSKFYAFQVLGSDGKKMTAGYAINVGDVVVIYGPIYNYKGNTPETAGKGAAYIVTINGKRTDEGSSTPTGEYGTKDAPLTVAKALEVINGLEPAGSVSPAYVKGKISKVQSFNDKYKSITYYISDDGSDTNALQVYSGKGLDGADFTAQTDLQVGWTVVVTGELKKYVNSSTGATTPEINQSSTIVSIDKTTGGNTTPDEGETKKVSVAEFLAASESTSDWYQLTGTVTHLEDGTYNNSTKYGNFDLVDETGSIYVYGVVTEKGGAKGQFADLMAAKGIKDGCKITIIGNRGSYKETAQVVNAYFVSVEAGSGDGGSSTGASSYSMDFKTNGIGSWTLTDKTKPSDIDAIWKYNSKYGMVATAYVNSTNYASESWIISPKFDLSGATKATLTLHHAINFFTSVDVAKTEVLIKVSTDGTNWTNLTLTGWPEKLGWTFFDSTADFSSYAGKKDVQIAFVYTSTAEKAGTWEIEKVTIE